MVEICVGGTLLVFLMAESSWRFSDRKPLVELRAVHTWHCVRSRVLGNAQPSRSISARRSQGVDNFDYLAQGFELRPSQAPHPRWPVNYSSAREFHRWTAEVVALRLACVSLLDEVVATVRSHGDSVVHSLELPDVAQGSC